MDDDAKFRLEHKGREEIEEAAARIGLHMQAWASIDLAEVNKARKRLEHEDEEGDTIVLDDEEEDHGDEGLLIEAVFVIGDLAFADHNLNPDEEALEEFMAEFEAEVLNDNVIDALRDGGKVDQILAKMKEDDEL